jgi:copper chaperone CopZ
MELIMKIEVDNINCGGCTSTITKNLNKAFDTPVIDIDIETGIINIEVASDKREEVIDTLKGLGYPEKDTAQGFDSVKSKAKSFVSCAVGKIDKNE